MVIYLFLLAALGLSCGMWDILVTACGLLVAACKLLAVTCMWDLVSRPGIESRPPALGAQSLTHQTIREVHVRECSNLIVLHVAIQFSQHCLLKRLSFFRCIFFPPLLKFI